MSNISKTRQMRDIEKNRNYIKYKLYALDVFRWEGLPNGIESRYIEQALCEHGQCFFYKNPAMGLVALKSYDTNKMNIYGDYDKIRVMSANGLINDELDVTEGVRIRNNELKEPTRGYIEDYSNRMTEVELAIKMNIQQQRFPYMVKTDKKSELSMRNMIDQIRIGEPAIFHSQDMKVNNIEVLPTVAPYVADRLNQYRFELEREVLTFLGINNNFEKKERVIVDEVNSNNEFIARNVEIQYKYRQMACEEINKMFGLNVRVVKVSDIVYDEMVDKQKEMQFDMQEEDTNNVYE